MSGWTKLFGSIVTSSIWLEDSDILRIWIAMLALADAQDVVEGTIPGFASLCRVPKQTMAKAIEIFSAPDPDSRTKDHDGRRIDIIPGGWKILNRAKYRERPQDMDGSRAAYYREWRKKQKSEPKPEHNNNDVAQSFTQQRNMAHHTDIDKEIEIDKYKDKHSVHSQQSFSQFWTAYPKKIGKKAALKAWLKAKDKPPIKNIIQSIEHQKTSNQWQKENGEYIPLPTTWINQGRWDDDISSYSQPVQNAFTSCPKCGKETSQRDITDLGSCPSCAPRTPPEKLHELLQNIGKEIK